VTFETEHHYPTSLRIGSDINKADFNPDGTQLAGTLGNILFIVCTSTGKVLEKVTLSAHCNDICFFENGKILIATNKNSILVYSGKDLVKEIPLKDEATTVAGIGNDIWVGSKVFEG